MAPTIRGLLSREVIDSRGNPTVEAEIALSDGSFGRAIVPSGASTGVNEALELRDNDSSRFLGKGVLTAVHNIDSVIRPQLLGRSFTHVNELDQVMLEIDGTTQKSRLGANSILAVSMAYVHALAHSQKRPLFFTLNELMERTPDDMSLPVPLMNIINGGLHANNGLEFQEFMIVAHGFGSFSESLRAGCEVFHHLKKILQAAGHSTAVGDEGGFAPCLESNERALQVILEAIERAGYQPGREIALALDVAASSFLTPDGYSVRIDGQMKHTSDSIIRYYDYLVQTYPIASIEDGLGEDDWSGWKFITRQLGAKTQLVGDDLFVTQSAHLQKGIDSKAANAILVKMNQVGCLSETFQTMNLARKNHFRCIVSHRSGETEDTTISHLAVASGCGQIKTGSLSRGERTAKYNELLRIESYAKQNALNFAYKSPFRL